MKIQNTTIFMGDASRSQRHGKAEQDRTGNKNIFAGGLNQKFDPIAQKRQQAREQAMKIVGDTWAGDKKIDDDIEGRRNRILQLRGEIRQARGSVREIEEQREALRESCGVEADSQEQRDLELLAKEMDAKTPWKQVSLTKEEGERIEQIRAQGLTEYQERSLEMKKGAEYYENQINEMKKEIEMENSIIRATRLERLKKDPMVKAQKQAEEIMEAASEEIVGMLADEAKDHIDEEMEEKKEAAQEKAEEAKELEEKLEKIKEKKEDQEELAEAIGELTEQTLQLDGVKTDIQEEIKDIVNKMKLLEEDIKGAVVDTTV